FTGIPIIHNMECRAPELPSFSNPFPTGFVNYSSFGGVFHRAKCHQELVIETTLTRCNVHDWIVGFSQKFEPAVVAVARVIYMVHCTIFYEPDAEVTSAVDGGGLSSSSLRVATSTTGTTTTRASVGVGGTTGAGAPGHSLHPTSGAIQNLS